MRVEKVLADDFSERQKGLWRLPDGRGEWGTVGMGKKGSQVLGCFGQC